MSASATNETRGGLAPNGLSDPQSGSERDSELDNQGDSGDNCDRFSDSGLETDFDDGVPRKKNRAARRREAKLAKKLAAAQAKKDRKASAKGKEAGKRWRPGGGAQERGTEPQREAGEQGRKPKNEASQAFQKPVRPKVHAEVERLLGKIGVPTPKPFKPDSFQVKAAELVKEHDVIVSAPTGSGKTWIARQALAWEMGLGGKSWYASPLKALSNSKFLEFGKAFGAPAVGLLTGDHKINTKAPILVGTTEILRNQLYDSMSGHGELDVDLVVLDEAHYIGDDERGVVWEEVLIYMPAKVRFLLLSATIDNAQELAAWLGHNRGRKVRVVQGGSRPVPLVPLCLDSGSLTSLANAPRDKPRGGRFNWRGGHVDPRIAAPEKRLMELASLNLLPAIFFLKSRRDCDNAVRMGKSPPEDQERAKERGEVITRYVSERPYMAKYPGLGALKREGLASHHAGHLPQFKMLVEELMSRNLLSAIFATSTVAAGVNFPARTVVIPQSDRFNGVDFSP